MSSRRKNTMPCPLGATSCPISPGRILPLHQHFPGTFRHSRRDQQCPGYDLWPPLTSAGTTTLVRPAIFCVSCPSTPARLITAPRWGAELRAASRSARSKPAPTPKGRKNHFESSSREFSNPNRCHAVTFFFYRVNNTQTVKFTLEAIERRVVDPAANTKVTNNSFASHGDVSTIPSAVLATDKKRLDIEGIGRTSVTSEQQATWPATFDCKRSTQPCWDGHSPSRSSRLSRSRMQLTRKLSRRSTNNWSRLACSTRSATSWPQTHRRNSPSRSSPRCPRPARW